MSYFGAIGIRRDIANIVRPPERLTVSEAATRYVNVRTSSGGIDSWDPKLTPYMVKPMNCLTSREYESVIFVGPAQSGKTQAMITCFLAYVLKCDKSDIMILQTSKDTARDFDMQVVKRTLRDSPELRKELAPGNKSDNTFDKVFRGGNILFQAWPSINKLSGKPLKYVLLTDYDRMDQDIEKEGSPFSLAQKRTTKFLSRGMTLVETSPGFEVSNPHYTPKFEHEAPPCGGALSLFNMGNMHRYYVQCPECDQYFMPPPDERGLDFIHTRDLFGATDAEIFRDVKYVCTKNGCLIDIKHKNKMNQSSLWVPQGCHVENGEIVGEARKSRMATFWFPGIFAAYSNPTALVEKYLNGCREYDITGNEQNLKTTINVDFAAPYLPRRLMSAVNSDEYMERAESLPKQMVPDGVRFLMASVDVQKTKWVVQIIGYGVNKEKWLIDRFDITQSERMSADGFHPVDPAAHIEDWFLIEKKVIKKRYPLADDSNREMAVLMTACDSGGRDGVTERAYVFWREMRRKQLHHRFILIKGERPKRTANKPKVHKSNPDKTSSAARKAKVTGELPLWLLNTTTLKDSIFADLSRVEPGDNYIHFPDWLGKWFYDELVAEKRTEEGWENPNKLRNETFDLFCYAEAAFLVKLISHWQSEINWESPPLWAETWDKNTEIYGAKPVEVVAEEVKPAVIRRTRMRSRR